MAFHDFPVAFRISMLLPFKARFLRVVRTWPAKVTILAGVGCHASSLHAGENIPFLQEVLYATS